MKVETHKLARAVAVEPQRISPALKRDWILDSAERLFAEHGYLKTTVGEIAAAANVAKGLVYVHFSSKKAMLEALMAREIDSWVQASLEGALAKGGDVTQMIANAFRTSIEYPRKRPFLAAILAQDPRLLLHEHEEETRRRTEPQRLVAYRALTEPLLQHGIKTGELRPDLDVTQMARVLWVIQDGLLRATFVTHDSVADPDAMIEAAIDFVKAGLRNASAPAVTSSTDPQNQGSQRQQS
jgi:AcrR family transcriptional regulator